MRVRLHLHVQFVHITHVHTQSGKFGDKYYEAQSHVDLNASQVWQKRIFIIPK